MKRARPLFLYIVFALLCAISPFARAAAYEAHGLAKYWESGPVRPGDHFLVKINIYILPGDGVIAEVSGQAAATPGIGISSIVGPGGNKKTGGSFAFTGSGFSGLSIDLKAAVKEGASENERITIYGVTAKLRNGTVLNVPQMTVNVPVAVQHTHTMQTVSRTEPTCTEEGEAILQCAGCGERVRQALAATGHSYGDMLAVPPACEQAGETFAVCSACGDKQVTDTAPATGHQWEQKAAEASTCVQRGWVLFVCANAGCGSERTEEREVIDHRYPEEEAVQQAGCTQDGRRFRLCSVCGHEDVLAVLPMTGHDYALADSHPATCAVDGWARYACAHDGCPEPEKTKILPAPGHNWGGEIAEPAACETIGRSYRRCGVCGEEEKISDLAPLGHDLVLKDSQPSDCLHEGWALYCCQRQGCTKAERKTLPLGGHSLGAEITEEPTCLRDGRRYRICGVCGAEEQADIIAAPGHRFGEWRPEKGFHCEKGGQYARNCAVCGEVQQRTEPAGQHRPGRLTLLRGATCAEDGEMGTVCLVCKEVTYSVAIKAPGHRFEVWTRPDSVSCAAGWQEQSACAVCGAQEIRQIAAGEHQFAAWSVTRAASCTQKGERRHICTVCNLPKTEEIPMRFHALGGPRIIRHPTCERAGETGLFCRDCDYVETYPLLALGHDWGKLSVPKGADCAAGWTGTRRCQRAGCTAEKPETIKPGDHRFGRWMIDTLPGCMKEGMKRHICDLCGAEQSEAVPAMGHRFGTPALITPPTCETEGESKLTCTVCDVAETYPLAALRHDWQVLSTTPAACTEKGQTEHQCSRCQRIKTEDIPAIGHQPGAWETVREASCGIKGQRKTACLVCAEAMAEAIPALGHSFQPWGVTLPSACEKAGEEQRECARCGFAEARTVPAGRHQLTLWTEERPATCAGKGVYHRSCEVCDFRETMYTEAKPHTFGAWQKAEYTDCTQGGIRRRACGVCGQEEERPTDRLKHWMGAWQTVQQAACEKEGLRERACKRCGIKETGGIAATGHKAAQKYTIVRKARAYHPGKREKLCVRCGAVLQKGQYSPSLQSMKVVFNPAGIPLKELLPGSTNQWYRLIPVDIRKQGVYTYPLVADDRHTVGDMTVTVGENSLTVSCAYLDDRTVVFKPMLRVFSSLEEITPTRIRRRVTGYALDQPIAFEHFKNADMLYLYLRVEGVYDDQRAVNAPFDAQSPAYLAQKEALLRMVPAR